MARRRRCSSNQWASRRMQMVVIALCPSAKWPADAGARTAADAAAADGAAAAAVPPPQAQKAWGGAQQQPPPQQNGFNPGAMSQQPAR